MWQLEKMETKHVLTEWRANRNISQKEFAEMIGVGKSTLNKIEKFVRKPSLDLAVKIQGATRGKIKPTDLIAAFDAASESQRTGEAA